MNGSTNPNNLNNWTQDPSGSTLIFPPTSFNNEGDAFIIDGETMSLTAIWIVAGEIRVYGSLQNPDWYRYQAKALSIYTGTSYMHQTSSNTSEVEKLFIGPSGQLYLGNAYGGNSIQVDSSCIVDGSLVIAHPMIGTGNFYLNSGGTLQTINREISTSGNTGNIRVSGIRQYSKQANYKYISSVGTYTTGNGLPDSVASLTIDNAENSNTSLTSSVVVVGKFKSGGAWGGSNDNSYILLNSNSITCLDSIYITGNVSITGDDQSAFILKGDDPATYSIRAMTIGNFTMDRDAEIIMRRNVTVSNSLTLLRGLIRTGNYVLQLGISSEGNIQQSEGRIIGNYATVKDNINTNPLLFPVGTGEFNRFLTITYTTPPTTSGLIKVSHKDSIGTSSIQALNDSGFIINFVLNQYWEVTPILVSGGVFNVTIDVDGQNAVPDPSVLRMVLSDYSGTQYFLNGSHSNGIGTIIKRNNLSGPNTFGRYYAGGDSDYVHTALISLNNGWNLLSVPLAASDMTGNTLFPTAISPFYAYNAGYNLVTTLENGKGYWAKFDASQSATITGNYVTGNEVSVVQGWNLIGPFAYDVVVSGITTVPPNILSSPFYGYEGGYIIPTTLLPGKGYWIKANQNGVIQLNAIQ